MQYRVSTEWRLSKKQLVKTVEFNNAKELDIHITACQFKTGYEHTRACQCNTDWQCSTCCQCKTGWQKSTAFNTAELFKAKLTVNTVQGVNALNFIKAIQFVKSAQIFNIIQLVNTIQPIMLTAWQHSWPCKSNISY